jgi:hypothetical protein
MLAGPTEEMALRSFSYIPKTTAIVPPETPGTTSAAPIASPENVTKGASDQRVSVGVSESPPLPAVFIATSKAERPYQMAIGKLEPDRGISQLLQDS